MAKVMISMPEDLLAALDAAAARADTTRSRFIRDAVRDRLARPEPHRRRAAIARLEEAFAGADLDPEAMIRAERER